MPAGHTKVFISHSTKDASFNHDFVTWLQDNYVNTWFAPRHIDGGYFEEDIRAALSECDWFLVILSPAALASEWVRKEVAIAMDDDRFRGRVIPVLIEDCNWQNIRLPESNEPHPYLSRLHCWDLVRKPEADRRRLLHQLGVVAQTTEPILMGDVRIPLHVFLGGDGRTRLRPEDIVCQGPGNPREQPSTRSGYTLPDEVRTYAEAYLPKRIQYCRDNDKVFVNNRQVRLSGISSGGPNKNGGLSNLPLHLRLDWTEYFHTAVTNMQTDQLLDNELTIGQAFASSVDNLHDCQLSNPIATNMNVVTQDNRVFYGVRSSKVQTMAGGYQPAVSGDGQPEDVFDGIYDPFHTALREAREECIGLLPEDNIESVEFFGLGRWMKTRFPFLFGEIRVSVTAKQLMGFQPTQAWEGERRSMELTVESVTDWVRAAYLDLHHGRLKMPVTAPVFNLLQSLRYAYPDRWLDVLDRLEMPELSGNSP